MFINISNHLSENWSFQQIEKASVYGDIIDLPFPMISPYCTEDEMNNTVQTYAEKILSYDHPVVMVQGEYVFTYRLVNRLKEKGIKVVASQSERRTIEYVDENGRTLRESEFQFVGFMEY